MSEQVHFTCGLVAADSSHSCEGSRGAIAMGAVDPVAQIVQDSTGARGCPFYKKHATDMNLDQDLD